MKRALSFIIISLFCFSLIGCNAKSDKISNEKIIAVSIPPQATFVQKVCGEKFDIVTVIPPGAEAETYEPSPRELAKFQKATIYFSIGISSEENNILPLISKNTKIIPLHEKTKTIYSDIKIGSSRDPHIWLSPKRVIVMIKAIAEAISDIDPDNKEFYYQNAENYCDELSRLDAEIKNILKDKENRKFIVFHPAFGYLAEDYSLSMYALEEHGKESNAQNLAKMADLAKKEKIKVIFYQAETSGRQAKAFAEEIGGKAVYLEPLSADYINNLKKMAKTLAEAMD